VPTDLLLPAFALTLAVNAIFVAVAIRALRADRTRETATRRPWSDGKRPVGNGAPSASTDPRSARPGRAAPPDIAAEGSEPAVRTRAGVAPVEPTPTLEPAEPVAEPVRLPSAPATERAAEAAVAPGPSERSSAPVSRRRRKFSLPPLDDDHDKVSRSIRTFLAGTEAPAVAAGDPAPSAGASVGSTDVVSTPAAPPIVTVASIQLVGGGPRDVLERTVRSTARATDDVSVDRRGRVRVVLSGTGEVAAHAYLRRIRATVEPLVEAADPASRIVIATATELDGDVATARRRADRRLTVALRAAPPATDPLESDEPSVDANPAPRAAGD
jgi:hypothetical protein